MDRRASVRRAVLDRVAGGAARRLAAMPLEGQWARQNTPTRSLGRRERRFARVAGVLLAIACAAVLAVIVLAGGSPAPAAGCVDETIASTTGGAQYHACGDAARRLCAQAAGDTGREGTAVRAACRRAGYGA
jgi:hypothetical protein